MHIESFILLISVCKSISVVSISCREVTYIRPSGTGRSDLGVIILPLAFQMTQQMKDNLRSTELGDGSRRAAWLMGLEESLSPTR